MPQDTVTLFRPTGDHELALIRDSGWRAFPPRLPEQSVFYPVLNAAYATVEVGFLGRYAVQTVGASVHQ